MPRLSLYRSDKSNDYRFFDRTISEMFSAGATDLYVHKYLGVQDNGPTASLSTPQQTTLDPTKIQDLLFLENRDRTYEPDIYRIRGHYNVQNLDFDLSQFGLFLNNDIIFITVHYNDMIQTIGRKLMVGDVFELPHLTDYHPLNELLPVSLRRYYQITDANFASEGFSQTWYPHLWRIKCEPLVDSQEFADILNQANTDSDGNETGGTLKDLMSPYLKNLAIDNAIVQQAENNLPTSGYDTEKFFVLPVDPETNESLQNEITADNINYTSDLTVSTPTQNIQGYLTGSSIAPNGFTVVSLTYFPEDPKVGEYCLRTDYLPNTLYRWDGLVWRIVNDVQRAALTGATNNTQLGTFVNNTNTSKITSGQTITQRQALSKILLPKSDF